jgi:hypothetical protein
MDNPEILAIFGCTRHITKTNTSKTQHRKPKRRATRTPTRNFRSELVRRFINIRGIIDHHQLNFLSIANYGIVIAFGLVYRVRYYTPTMELISCDIIEILSKTLLTTQNYNQPYYWKHIHILIRKNNEAI